MTIEVINVYENGESIYFGDEWLIKTVEVVVLPCEEEVIWVLYLEDLLELSFNVLNLCFVVYFY
jgi:hypothetical protein